MLNKQEVEKLLKSIVAIGLSAQSDLHNGRISGVRECLEYIESDIKKINVLLDAEP